MAMVVGIGLLAALPIFGSIAIPPAEPIDTTAWLAATTGDTVIVTDVTGRKLNGDVIRLRPDTISLWTSAGELRIDRRDVRLVRQRFADPRADGTIKGLCAGGLAAFIMFAAAQSELGAPLTETVGVWSMTGILTMGGMAVGRIVDKMVMQERVIYSAPSRSRTTLAPFLLKDATGAGVIVAW